MAQQQSERKEIWGKRHDPKGISKILLSALLLLLVCGAAATQTVSGRRNKARRQAASVCTEPAGGRVVTILLKGLFFCSFPDAAMGSNYRTEGRVGILSTRQDHTLYVRYNEGGTTFKTLMFPHSALQSMAEEIAIAKAGSQGVKIYGYTGRSGWGAPSHRTSNSGQYDDIKNFSWILDFEGSELHGHDVQVGPGKLRPVLRFNVGTFYTHQLSDYPFYIVQNRTINEFGYAAAVIGVCIELERGEFLTINLGGGPVRIPDTTTQIELYNVRPEDYEYARSVVTKSLAPKNAVGRRVNLASGGHEAAGHSDEIDIFYDDLLELPDKRMRYHFIPIMEHVGKSDPFVCYGGGGSVWP